MSRIRVSAKAIIIQEHRLLVTKNADVMGFFYLLPGGGQEPGESLTDALKRECLEEIGVQVEVGKLMYVRDYIGVHHEFNAFDAEIHQVEIIFACTLPQGAQPCNGHHPDSHQLAVEWLDINELQRYRLYPRTLAEVLQKAGGLGPGGYLGDVN